ncbi:hypothetical protein AKL21_02885 [Enterococcus canintestini]|uniref:Uncharacterized protein n=1 Tax=Enterococcus canintestini TaxID=317010 RepID=A0A267HU72_9ENTE|nr:hypothetical protein AKL21_02885 [Enterococcus canintestini]
MKLDPMKSFMNSSRSQAIGWNFNKLFLKFLQISAYCRRELVHEAGSIEKLRVAFNSFAIRQTIARRLVSSVMLFRQAIPFISNFGF